MEMIMELQVPWYWMCCVSCDFFCGKGFVCMNNQTDGQAGEGLIAFKVSDPMMYVCDRWLPSDQVREKVPEWVDELF